MRKIQLKHLIISGLLYRMTIVSLESFIFYLLMGELRIAIMGAISLNLIKTIWYVIFHQLLLKGAFDNDNLDIRKHGGGENDTGESPDKWKPTNHPP